MDAWGRTFPGSATGTQGGASYVINSGSLGKILMRNFLRPAQQGPGEQVLLVLLALAGKVPGEVSASTEEPCNDDLIGRT